MNTNEWIEFQKSLPKIDTHEHIAPEEHAMQGNTDIFDVLLVPYNCDTLQAAGCTREEWAFLMDKTKPFFERYGVLRHYLPYIRYTSFFRAVQRTLQLEFGQNDFTLESLLAADEMLKAQLRDVHYASMMERANISHMLCFSGYDALRHYTDPSVRFVPTVSEILPRNQADLARLEKVSDIRIFDLDTCLKAISVLFKQYAAAGVSAIKFGSAYRRTLAFGSLNYHAAQGQLQEILNFRIMGDEKNNGSTPPSKSYDELTALDDYLTDYMLSLSDLFNFTVVFHVAMHAWNENDPERAHAHYLCQTIQKYSRVNFVLLHAGAPFFEEAVLMARYYPNVYLDLTWFHIISPQMVRQAILRILELVPTNKVFAFGGDYCYIHSLQGHLNIAMENFAIAFQQACNENVCTDEQAKDILHQWYFENPKKVFKIETQKNQEEQQ